MKISPEPIRIAGLNAIKWIPRATGRRRAILFVHGWWGGAWVWDRFAPWFASKGYVCYAIDLTGSDCSAANTKIGNVSFYQHLDDVRRVVESLDRPILMGHSVGGLLVQKMAETNSVSACVALVSAAPRGINSLATFQLWRFFMANAIKMLLCRPFLPSRKRMYEMDLNGLSPAEQRQTYDRMVAASGRQGLELGVLGIPVDANHVGVPIAVIGGKNDNLTPPALTRRIAKKYGADYREYAGHAHYLMREQGWERIATDISHWLEKNRCGRVQ